MARPSPLCKPQLPTIPRLFTAARCLLCSPTAETVGSGRPGPLGQPYPAAEFYDLLCMFNGFAFARPLCGWIKVNILGVGLG